MWTGVASDEALLVAVKSTPPPRNLDNCYESLNLHRPRPERIPCVSKEGEEVADVHTAVELPLLPSP
jgi:hypothetical protein